MKKQILNVGKTLTKAEQKQINGGTDDPCVDSNKRCRGNHQCPKDQGCYIISDDFPIVAVCLCSI